MTFRYHGEERTVEPYRISFSRGQWYVAGFDRAPAGGRFPTSRWQPGDRILSRFALTTPPDLTPGEYSVWLGLYDADSQGQTRLPVSGAGGLASMHDMVRVESVTVR